MTVGEMITCPVCGTQFEYVHRGKAKYCSTKCSRKMANIQAYGAWKRHYEKEKAERRKEKEAKKKSSKKAKTKPLTLTEVAVLARKEGMTYGEYVQKHGL